MGLNAIEKQSGGGVVLTGISDGRRVKVSGEWLGDLLNGDF